MLMISVRSEQVTLASYPSCSMNVHSAFWLRRERILFAWDISVVVFQYSTTIPASQHLKRRSSWNVAALETLAWSNSIRNQTAASLHLRHLITTSYYWLPCVLWTPKIRQCRIMLENSSETSHLQSSQYGSEPYTRMVYAFLGTYI